MKKLLVILFLLIITVFSVIGFTNESHTVNEEVRETEQGNHMNN